jgi:branched-chain amino acid aminotransferase
MEFRVWKLEPGDHPSGLQPVHLVQDVESLDGISEYLPSGAYTTLRTYRQNRILPLERHIRRLEESAELIGKPCTLDVGRLRAALRQITSEIPAQEDVRLRLTLDLEQQPGTVYIVVESLQTPSPREYAWGVKALTRKMERRIPRAKLTGFISRARQVRADLPADVNEVILVDAQGYLREGLSSNFFAVIDGEIFTASEGVLAGITRSLVLDVIARMELPVCWQAIHLTHLPDLDEAFITSSSRAVLAIVQIDGMIVGSGKPGEITQALMGGYQALIAQMIEPI